MTHVSKVFRLSAAFAAGAMVLGSSASAAPVGFSTADPLVSLSLFGTSASRAAVCAAASTAAAGAAATAGQPAAGCVLPVLGAPPVVATVPPPVVTPVAAGFGGVGSLLPLAAIAALGALAIWRLETKDDDAPEPISPA